MVSIQFLGAAGTVTGSKHFLKTPNKNILIDCGLFQGLKDLRLRNRESLPVNIEDIHLIILTHAHLDHCGYLPLLSKNGYKGKILMTAPTADLTRIVLLDSAKIQEEDAEKANKHMSSKHAPAIPLYKVTDAERVIKQFEVVEHNKWEEITQDIKFRFIPNGHILGSSFIDMICHGKSIFFSGDIGRNNSEMLRPPTVVEGCDHLVMESTYGDRLHGPTPSKDQLADVINEAMRSKGNVLIPSFAIGRAQELMHLIAELKKEIRIPDVPIYLDSPMGASATKIFMNYPEWHKLTAEECKSAFKDVKIITEHKETVKNISDPHIKIVIAASGMLTGGRVLEYLQHYIGDSRNTIVLVGFQAEGTRGRALKNGAHEVKIFGKYYEIRANVTEITSLSAHADQGEMMGWMKQFTKRPEKIFLVHGENYARDAFRIKIKDELGIESFMPNQNDEIMLF